MFIIYFKSKIGTYESYRQCGYRAGDAIRRFTQSDFFHDHVRFIIKIERVEP